MGFVEKARAESGKVGWYLDFGYYDCWDGWNVSIRSKKRRWGLLTVQGRGGGRWHCVLCSIAMWEGC
jgi:hypothetical protein